MIIAGLTFYVFAAVAVAAGFMVIAARNPVHSVLFLILAFLQYLPIGALVGLILLVELVLVLGTASGGPEAVAAGATPAVTEITNTRALGALLYTRYVYFFEAAGMLLLIAMVGAIVLTLRQREGVRKQSIADQVHRRPEESVELKKVEPGQGA